MTVLEVIQRSTEFLANKGVDSARLQSELLLAHALKMPRMKLYLDFERTLTSAELDATRELVKRRSQREPLQHITGSTSFCGLEIAVNKHVLVPRPETELLAEMGWQFLGKHPTSNIQHPTSNEQRAGSETGAPTALDFGTGSGCIAILLAVKCPAAQIVALDISPDALEVARQNAVQHHVAERIQFFQGDGFGALNKSSEGRVTRVPNPPGHSEVRDSCNSSLRYQFDLIISNPPYIPSAEIATLQTEVRDHDPKTALDGGADGLDFYRRLAAEAGAYLKPAGKLMVEFGDGQAEADRQIFEREKWVVEAMTADYSQRARILTVRK